MNRSEIVQPENYDEFVSIVKESLISLVVLLALAGFVSCDSTSKPRNLNQSDNRNDQKKAESTTPVQSEAWLDTIPENPLILVALSYEDRPRRGELRQIIWHQPNGETRVFDDLSEITFLMIENVGQDSEQASANTLEKEGVPIVFGTGIAFG